MSKKRKATIRKKVRKVPRRFTVVSEHASNEVNLDRIQVVPTSVSE